MSFPEHLTEILKLFMSNLLNICFQELRLILASYFYGRFKAETKTFSILPNLSEAFCLTFLMNIIKCKV